MDVVVINDGSGDRTAEAARQSGAVVITLPFNLGIGGAVQTGFLYAVKHQYDFAVQIDGDNQHDVSFVEILLAPVLKGEADIAVGSRFIPPYLGYQSSSIRRIGIHFFAGLISAVTGFKVADPTSGFRAFNQKAIRIFSREYPADYPEPESIVVARRRDLRLLEVPVQMRKRPRGKSSIRYFRTLHYMVKVTFAILIDMIKKKKEV
jgi:glycosyltransferase involved in cell wall biosynthesis